MESATNGKVDLMNPNQTALRPGASILLNESGNPISIRLRQTQAVCALATVSLKHLGRWSPSSY